MAKQLEKNELQQQESIPETKPVIPKLKLTADDLQQYGRLHGHYGDADDFGWLSWLSPTYSLIPRILINFPYERLLIACRIWFACLQAY